MRFKEALCGSAAVTPEPLNRSDIRIFHKAISNLLAGYPRYYPLRCSALREQSLGCRWMLHFPPCGLVLSTISDTSSTSSLIKVSHTGSVLTCRKWGWIPALLPPDFCFDKDTKTLGVAEIKVERIYLSCGGNYITHWMIKNNRNCHRYSPIW